MFKAWLSKSFLDIKRSTSRDYPAKKKKPWLADSFAEMEHFHKDTYRPFGYPVLPPRVKDGCAGRILRPLTQIEWPCGEDKPQQFQTKVSGAVGSVTYSMDPFFSEVNENGDLAVIDQSGIMQIGDEETEVCQGPYPPWVIYTVCDDCGCSSGTIWLQDCSGDCFDCDTCDCDSGDDCVADCCFTGGEGGEIEEGGTLQLSCGGGGVWSAEGTGISVDQTGLVSATSEACGVATITNSVCGVVELRVTGINSDWVAIDFCQNWFGVPGNPAHCGIYCTNTDSCIRGVFRYEVCHNPSSPVHEDAVCGDICGKGDLICSIRTYEWQCN